MRPLLLQSILLDLLLVVLVVVLSDGVPIDLLAIRVHVDQMGELFALFAALLQDFSHHLLIQIVEFFLAVGCDMGGRARRSLLGHFALLPYRLFFDQLHELDDELVSQRLL